MAERWFRASITPNLQGGYRPRVMTVEFNRNFGAKHTITSQREWHPWTQRSVFGASAAAIDAALAPFGYRTLHIMPEGLDMFLVREDVLASKGCRSDMLPTFMEVAATASLGERVHGTCSAADAARLVDSRLAIEGRMKEARAAARKAVAELNELNPGDPMCRVS